MNSRSPHRTQQPLLPGLHEEDKDEGIAEEKQIASVAADSPADHQPEAVPVTDVQPAPVPPNQPPPLVIAVDTHAILYQVFHAMPPLTSPGGLPVGAIHGMLRDLLEIRERYRPDYLFFTFDLSEDTFRNEIYPDYKGHREEMPVDLRLQMPLARQALEALQVPILEIAGYEADDIIATIASQSEQRGWRCLIVSPDKDCRQLLTENVQILNLRKQEIFGISQLKETWGITPEQVVDFQAMVGDSVDNVPGIPLIGPKIAQQLLEQYGTLDAILAHPDAVSGTKRRENMVRYRDQALMSRQLVKLCREVPISIPWHQADEIQIDKTKIAELFQNWGIRSLADRFLHPKSRSSPSHSAEAAATAPSLEQQKSAIEPQLDTTPFDLDKYRLIQTEEALQQLCEELEAASLIALDSETTSTQARWAKPVGYSFAWGQSKAAYIPVRAPLGEDCLSIETVHRYLKPILENPAIRKVGQNLKYDLIIFRGQGIDVQGIYFETMVADYLLDPGNAITVLMNLPSDTSATTQYRSLT